MTPSCGTCKHFRCFPDAVRDVALSDGQCWRYPPMLRQSKEGQGVPYVDATWLCGEYQEKANDS